MITAFYAGFFGLILFLLSLQVIRERYATRTALGDGDHPRLQRFIRVQANFCEYTPLCLVIIGFAEISGQSDWLLHSLLAALLIGRTSHAWGVSQESENLKFRQIGMLLTFAVLAIASIAVIIAGF